MTTIEILTKISKVDVRNSIALVAMGLLTSASAAAILSSMVWFGHSVFCYCDRVGFFSKNLCARHARTQSLNNTT